jgi:glyoxalase superfamily protein
VAATKTQVVFDTAYPDRLAHFWKEALHYKVQDPPAGFATWEAALKAWNVPEDEWNSTSAIVDPEGRGPRILFQQMDTPKPGKNRLHLDLNVSGGYAVSPKTRKSQVDKEVDRLLGLGATKQKVWDEPPRSKGEPGEYWVVLLDPEGNEFCVQ